MLQQVNVGVLSSQNKIKKLIQFGAQQQSQAPQFQVPFEESHETVISSHNIYLDNTISFIKYKVLQELKGDAAYEELYFFIENRDQKLPWTLLFDGSEREPTPEMFTELINNVPTIRGKIDPAIATYDDFVKIAPNRETILRPLGFHVEGVEPDKLLFPANPFLLSDKWRLEKNKPVMFDHELLLNYLPTEMVASSVPVPINIYVCLAEDMFQINGYSPRALELYYPLLHSKNVLTEEDLYDRRNSGALTQIKTAVIDPIDNYYSIHAQPEATPLPPYSEIGVRAFHIKLRPDNKFLLPLDSVFKILQTNAQVPFVKYNPGARRENVYRLYSEKIAKNGKKIPYMNKNEINNLVRKIGKSRQVAIYVTRADMRDIDIHHHVYLYCVFESNGDMTIYSDDFERAIPIDKLETVIRELTSPIISNITDHLGASGYIINPFQTFYSTPGLEIVNIKYVWSMLYDKPGNIKKQVDTYSGCYSALFERVLNLDDLKRGVNLKYRRVENYQEMEGEKELIAQLFREYGNARAVVAELVGVYNKTETEAAKMIARFIDSVGAYKDQGGKIKLLENPGFSTVIRIEQFELGGINKPNLVVEVDDITAFSYINLLNLYIPAFLRLFIYPKTLPADFLRNLSKKCRASTTTLTTEAEAAAVAIGAAAVAEAAKGETEDDGLIKNIYEDATEMDEEEEVAAVVAEAEKEIATPPKIDVQNIIDFMGADEDEDWGEEEDDDKMGGAGEDDIESLSPPATNAAPQLLDDTSLHPSPFLTKMNKLDPILFSIPNEQKDKFVNYSRTCPVFRQPVILTDAEKQQIDAEHPGVYDKAIRYGSTPNKQHWYICPRYWCLLTNSAISEEDVRAGKCGNIISRKAKKIPKGAYVYEFTDDGKEHIHPSTGKYIKHYPGLTKTKHPRNLKYPCCFKKWDPLLEKYTKQLNASIAKSAEEESDAEESDDDGDGDGDIETPSPSPKKKAKSKHKVQTADVAALDYIFAPEKVYIARGRWGFLPVVIQRFLQTNNSLCVTVNEPNKMREGVSCILRHGVEENSFLGCIAEFYAFNRGIKTPSLEEMRAILIRAISVDNFMKFHSGELVKSFFVKYLTPKEFQQAAKKYGVSSASNNPTMNMVLSALEHFVYFLKNAAIEEIDYTYLWDIVCSPDTILFEKGINLAILEVPEIDNTTNVEIICPTNVYSAVPIYDGSKETAIIIKNGRIYTPVYSVALNAPPQKLFSRSGGGAPENIRKMLEFIEFSTNRNCAPLPTRIQFKRAIPIQTIISRLSAAGAGVVKKVYNHYNNVIGLLIRDATSAVGFVPCAPFQNYGAVLPEIPAIYINSPEATELWLNYEDTVEFLRRFATSTGLTTKPIVKIMDDGYIVGVLTETNQFVQLSAPEQDLHDDDGLRAIQNTNFITAEREIAEARDTEDEERKRVIKYISLETKFYNTFRILIRAILNKYENIAFRRQITQIIASSTATYKSKLREIENILIKIMQPYVEFMEYRDDVLMEIETISGCGDVGSTNKKYCMVASPAGAPPKFLIPRKNLLHPEIDNTKIYYGRITDELLRHNRIRSFMFQSRLYLNLSEIKYNLTENEIILLQSAFTSGNYFDSLIPEKYIIPFQRAIPAVSQKYKDVFDYNAAPTQTVPEAQPVQKEKDVPAAAPQAKEEENAAPMQCIKEIKDNPIGNNRALWVKRFPLHCKEIIFQDNSPICSFGILQHIVKMLNTVSPPPTIVALKQQLLNNYKSLFDAGYSAAVAQTLKKEGKVFIQENFEYFLMSETYYITNFDIWLYFSRYGSIKDTSIILFSALKLKEISETFNQDIDWIFMTPVAATAQNYIFIRSPTTFVRGKTPSYSLITPVVKKGELRVVDFQNTLNYPPKENSISIEKYLDILPIAAKATKKRIILKPAAGGAF